MRHVALGCVLVLITAVTTEARRSSPGVSFTATLESGATGATAPMIWTTRRNCTLGPTILDGRPEFRCAGRWRCDGDACPGRRGRLEFTFDPDGFHEVLLKVSPQSVCTAHFVGVTQEPQRPPYHWFYQCFTLHPTTQIDFGEAVVAFQVPQ
jgi:hypothetical protein